MGRKLLGAAALLFLAAIWFLGRPILHLATTWNSDEPQSPAMPQGMLDDAGRYSATEIDSVIVVPDDSLAALLAVQAALRNAELTRRKISIGGARHSMGGQTLFPHSLYLDMSGYKRLSLDTAAGLLRAAAGARWFDILPYLDARGFSIKVMQGNANFTVGGSVSVNCHGWQPDHAPIASTVEALRMVTADRREVRCSRSENRELFSLALGGYGLFGVILDVELRVIANEAYAPKRMVLPAGFYAQRYGETVSGDPEVGLAYARLNVAKAGFLEEALLKYFVRVPDVPPPLLPADRRLAKLIRAVYMGSARDEYGKTLRWTLEKKLEPLVTPKILSRNQILAVDGEVYANHSASSVDVLQEYFIPVDKLGDFIRDMRTILPIHTDPALMNVSIRSVAEDKDTFLRYADEEMFGLVLSLRVGTGTDGDAALAALASDLIDKAIGLGGTFYLPYRLHSTPDQLLRAYPKAPAFFALKRKYDPGEVFQNKFYETYGNYWVDTP